MAAVPTARSGFTVFGSESAGASSTVLMDTHGNLFCAEAVVPTMSNTPTAPLWRTRIFLTPPVKEADQEILLSVQPDPGLVRAFRDAAQGPVAAAGESISTRSADAAAARDERASPSDEPGMMGSFSAPGASSSAPSTFVLIHSLL